MPQLGRDGPIRANHGRVNDATCPRASRTCQYWEADRMAHRYTTQVAGDVQRDGVGVELLSETGAAVAEVFRSDRDHAVVLNTYGNDIPLEAVEVLLARARVALEPF